jgi:Ala-tRNA(Pro) deacylase
MTTPQKLITLLKEKDCWYRHDKHAQAFTALEVADADQVPPRCFAKVVIVHYEEGYAMAVLPADKLADLEELRAAFGSRVLRLANEDELSRLFPECELGAMPPFGNGALYDLPVWADGLLMAEETVCFNAGTHRDVVRMNTDDWESLVRPQVISFAHS